jgi:predicted nuclease of restriction endonuclease-like RecB superfamily
LGSRRGTATVYDGQRYKSAFEAGIARNLTDRSLDFRYEEKTLLYTTSHVYRPDFTLDVLDDVVIEAKGYFPSTDRTKLLAVAEANPRVDIRLVFQNAKTRLTRGSKTTYAQWAERHGFVWAEKIVPDEWIR